MVNCFNSSNNCGRSRSSINIPQNAIASPLTCSLPCVGEFSTAISRFQNQIVRDVLTALSTRCKALAPAPVPPPSLADLLPAGTMIMLNNFTTTDQNLTMNATLQIEAQSITGTNVSLQNVRFVIVGFGSLIVEVSGEAVLNMTYLGVDDLVHAQTVVMPFSFIQAVPGNYQPNVTVQGNLSVSSQLVVTDIDPSTLAITGMSMELFFTTNIQVLLPV